MTEANPLFIDGDLFIYRCSYACKDESLVHAKSTMDRMLGAVLMHYPETPYQVYLSGSSVNNYRHEYAVTAPYKGNRKTEKPLHYDDLRAYLMNTYDCSMTTNNEADDAIAIDYTAAMKEQDGNVPCIVSIDKDFDQLAGLRYDFLNEVEVWKTELEADLNLYRQVMEGDVADNIKGVYGVGKVKATKLLEECTTIEHMYNVCVETFVDKGGLTEEEAEVRVIENLNLLYLQRNHDEYWGDVYGQTAST